jgi:hypothetical protein
MDNGNYGKDSLMGESEYAKWAMGNGQWAISKMDNWINGQLAMGNVQNGQLATEELVVY